MSKFALIGGDKRNVLLAKMLEEDKHKIYKFGLEKALSNNCKTLNEAVEKAEFIIGPIPFSKNGKELNAPYSNRKIKVEEITSLSKKVIAGAFKHKNIIDIMEQEELAIQNTISTAEGTIEIIISNTEENIQGSKILILGFGRVAKTLANKLHLLGAKVVCSARKKSDLVWAKTYGYNGSNNIKLKDYNIIINTIPYLVLDKNKLEKVNKNTLIIDLASGSGGVDFEAAKNLNLNCIWALALPGKVAPLATAKIIKNSIYNIIGGT